MFLRPTSTFKIIWQTADPNDSTTYYPQVTIYKSLDSSVLAGPFNLTLESNGRYSYNWQVPNDPTGQGMQIDQTVSVYTDSGHTVYSANYTKENRVYTIFDLAAALLRTGGGDNTDYKLIEKIVDKKLAAIEIPDHSKSIRKLGNILPKSEVFTEQKTAIDKVAEDLESFKDNQKKDFEIMSEQVLTGIQNLAETLGKIEEAVSKNSNKALDKIGQYDEKLSEIPSLFKNVVTTLKIFTKAFSNIETITVKKVKGMEMPAQTEEKTEPAKPDFTELAKQLVG